MNDMDFADSFLKNIKITFNTKDIATIIFDENFKILYTNNIFHSKFRKTYINSQLDFLFRKKDDFIVNFSDFPISELLTYENQVFSFTRSPEHELFFNCVTHHAGIHNGKEVFIALLYDVSECKYKQIFDTIHALVKASQLKDNDTGSHVQRLNEYSRVLAQHIKDSRHSLYPEIDDDFIERIGIVASMHDIGKIGIPDYILTKPAKLTDEEFEIMKEHTINGAFILSELAGKMARDIALFHHEKWNGEGYPYHLKEDQIPTSARILMIGDVFDALRMERCYKPAFPQEKAVQIIMDSKGTHFDPAMTDAFYEIRDKFNDIFQSNKDD